MADDKDVLGKADALLRRHAPAGEPPADVPTLTDLAEGADAASALAREVSQRVMSEVERRFASELERRIAQNLSPQVQAAVAGAVAELRQELFGAVGKAVEEALAARRVK